MGGSRCSLRRSHRAAQPVPHVDAQTALVQNVINRQWVTDAPRRCRRWRVRRRHGCRMARLDGRRCRAEAQRRILRRNSLAALSARLVVHSMTRLVVDCPSNQAASPRRIDGSPGHHALPSLRGGGGARRVRGQPRRCALAAAGPRHGGRLAHSASLPSQIPTHGAGASTQIRMSAHPNGGSNQTGAPRCRRPGR